jgi:hypothetical protein
MVDDFCYVSFSSATVSCTLQMAEKNDSSLVSIVTNDVIGTTGGGGGTSFEISEQSQQQNAVNDSNNNGIVNNKPYVPPAAKYWRFKEQPHSKQRKSYKHDKSR